MYTAGTYVVGYALGMESWFDFFKLEYIIYLIYFIFPANVFLYGVNDFWDEETDKFNPKKNQIEYLINEKDRNQLQLLLLLIFGFSLILLFFQKNLVERLIFGTFLFLSYFYSAKPLRFKIRPFLDFSSNILYIIPGIFAYYMVSETFPPLLVIFAGFLHISAMHLFSAIPDIKYDIKAKIKTTAVVLKKKPSLILCFIIWFVFSITVIYLANYRPLSFLVLIYPIAPLALLLKEELNIERIYWYFPYINTSLGGFLFSLLTINKLYIF